MKGTAVLRGGLFWGFASLGFGAIGCSGAAPVAKAPEAPTESAKCKVAASQQNPLVTEWPASEKANLESALKQGPVVVAYAGCSLRMLSQCKAPKCKYAWQNTTDSSEQLEIRNADELYAKLPLGAVTLEGELERSGRLAMQTTVTGQLVLDGLAVADVPTSGDCAGATHVLARLSVGAFKLKSGGAVRAGASVGLAGASTGSEEMLMREAGKAEQCPAATDQASHPDCASPIQMFLWPLPSAAKEADIPPGALEARFASEQADTTWEVVIDNQVACTTPCTRHLPPRTPVLLRTADQPGKEVETISLDHPKGASPGTPVDVRASRRNQTTAGAGVALGTSGAMGLLGGGLLVGFSQGSANESGDSCSSCLVPGLLSAGGGVVLLTLGIVLSAGAGADAEVTPVGAGSASLRRRRSQLAIGPGFVAGSF